MMGIGVLSNFTTPLEKREKGKGKEKRKKSEKKREDASPLEEEYDDKH